MSMQNPIADMLTKIRNAQAVVKSKVVVQCSKIKIAIAEVLKKEGYISDYEVKEGDSPQKKNLILFLKYYEGKPVIDSLTVVSRPGLRIYRSADNLPRVNNGLGIAIISTPNGVITDQEARKFKVGGEVLCYVT